MCTRMAFLVIGPFDLPWQHVTATMRIDPSIKGTVIRVVGHTDLPDGALIDFGFSPTETFQGSVEGLATDVIDGSLNGSAKVTGGLFSFERDLAGLPSGRWSVYASFSTAWGSEQPRQILETFGAEGEHLAGPQVYVDSPGDPKQLLTSAEFDLP